jgi:hypothetical protein
LSYFAAPFFCFGDGFAAGFGIGAACDCVMSIPLVIGGAFELPDSFQSGRLELLESFELGTAFDFGNGFAGGRGGCGFAFFGAGFGGGVDESGGAVDDVAEGDGAGSGAGDGAGADDGSSAGAVGGSIGAPLGAGNGSGTATSCFGRRSR